MLEKILQEIEQYETKMEESGVSALCPGWVKEIIKKHLSANDLNVHTNDGKISIDDERLWQILFDEACVEGQQADRIYKQLKEICGDGWIPVEERLPENAKRINAFCPKYQIMTQYGITEGWYNTNQSGWYALFWFMTRRCEESEINFEKGDVPKIVFIPDRLTEKVIAWRPMPEPYRKDGE